MTDNITRPAAAVHEARGWLLDCGFCEDTLDELSDRLVVAVVDANYDGGWPQFLLAIDSLLEEAGPIEATTAPPLEGTFR
ncbi:hypothetical protein CH263_06350 [Rhodococcus sp. 06-1059B-a]|nr:hypothetical protein [Rhodococcus sp. 06-1059B-a]OZD70535.1 hypothetical protein CH263_06350 [Rhodococcus sp. 06-1059B-a]